MDLEFVRLIILSFFAIILITITLPVNASIYQYDYEGYCGGWLGDIFIKKLSDSEKVCVTEYVARQLTDKGEAVFYYDLPYIEISGRRAGIPSPGSEDPGFDAKSAFFLYGLDGNYYSTMIHCQNGIYGAVRDCVVQSIDGKQTKITNDFDEIALKAELLELGGEIQLSYCSDFNVIYLLKFNNDYPLCVSTDTGKILVERGYGKYLFNQYVELQAIDKKTQKPIIRQLADFNNIYDKFVWECSRDYGAFEDCKIQWLNGTKTEILDADKQYLLFYEFEKIKDDEYNKWLERYGWSEKIAKSNS